MQRISKAIILVTCIFYAQSALATTPFSSCVAQLKERALQASISQAVVDKALDSVEYSPRVIELDRKQPEFSQTFYNYHRKRVTQARVDTGRELMEEHRPLLQRLTNQYGVPAHYLVSFWGMETNFGRYLGKMDTLDSLTTLACDPRRSEFFTTELLEALRLLDAGIVANRKMEGSWAGAMGNMQFMPSTYRRFGLDGDNDGKVDMWGSLRDAFTSASFYLNQLGWEEGWRWGREVLLPKGFDYSQAGLGNPRPLEYWSSLGVTDTAKRPVPKIDKLASLIVPAGHNGPVFLAYENFKVIMKWNYSEFYALSVGILADRIKGSEGLTVTPPQVDNFSIAEIKAIQESLNALGFNVGPVDGIFGSQTKKGLRQFQRANGLVADGFPHPEVVAKLKSAAVESDKNKG